MAILDIRWMIGNLSIMVALSWQYYNHVIPTLRLDLNSVPRLLQCRNRPHKRDMISRDIRGVKTTDSIVITLEKIPKQNCGTIFKGFSESERIALHSVRLAWCWIQLQFLTIYLTISRQSSHSWTFLHLE